MIHRKELRHGELPAKLVCELSEPYHAESTSQRIHSIHLNLESAPGPGQRTEAEEGQYLDPSSTVQSKSSVENYQLIQKPTK